MQIPIPFNGHVMWANGLPASGVSVRVIDDTTDIDITIPSQVTSAETGYFEGTYYLDRATQMIEEVVVWWTPRFDFPPVFPPQFDKHETSFRRPDPGYVFRPRYVCSYSLFGQQFTHEQPLSFFDRTIRLPHVGIGFSHAAFGIGTGRNGSAVLFDENEGAISHTRKPDQNTVWQQYSKMSGPVQCGSQLAVVQDSQGWWVLFARNQNGNLVMRKETATQWTDWANLGGNLAAPGTLAATLGIDNKLIVLVRWEDGSIKAIRETNWNLWETLNGVVAPGGSLVACRQKNGSAIHFHNGVDGKVYAMAQTQNGTWGGFVSVRHSKFLAGPLTAARNKDTTGNWGGLVNVFAQGIDGSIYVARQKSTNSNAWGSWKSLGGVWIGKCLKAEQNQDGRIELFVVNKDHGYSHIWQHQAAGDSWSDWASLGDVANYRTPPSERFNIARLPNKALYIVHDHYYRQDFYRNEGRILLSRSQVAANAGWGNWQELVPAPSSTTTQQPPDAPIITSVTAYDGGITVKWTPTARASGYRLFYGTEKSPFYCDEVTVGDVNLHNIGPLLSATRYFVAVKALGPGGESAYTDEFSAIPTGSLTTASDLEIVEARVEPPNPDKWSTFNIIFRIKNNGQGSTGCFTVLGVRDGQNGSDGKQYWLNNVPSLPPGGEIEIVLFQNGQLLEQGTVSAHWWALWVGDSRIGYPFTRIF